MPLIIRSLIAAIIIFLGAGTGIARAYVMSSENFRLERDSINIGGNEEGASDNYRLSDTIGEIGTGDSSSSNYNIKAGYRQMDETSISITVSGSINLEPSIGGISGGAADGYGEWNVTTDSPSGYTLDIRSTGTPAMISGSNYFADYSPVSASIPDLNWDIGSVNSEFGFSPYNSEHQSGLFKNDGADCGQGGNISDQQCWFGLAAGATSIAYSPNATSLAGSGTKINFKAEVNSVDGHQISGVYTATIIVTASSN